MTEIIIKPFHALPCSCEVFTINGISADVEDFGITDDEGSHYAEKYCCGNMMFRAKLPTQEVLDKYKITVKEYAEVCDDLCVLSVGQCRYCS